MIHAWTVAAVAFAWVATAGFVVRYALVRWQETPGGHAIMALSASTLTIASGCLMDLLGAPVLAAPIVATGWSCMAVAMFWRWGQLIKAQRGLPAHDIGPTKTGARND